MVGYNKVIDDLGKLADRRRADADVANEKITTLQDERDDAVSDAEQALGVREKLLQLITP